MPTVAGTQIEVAGVHANELVAGLQAFRTHPPAGHAHNLMSEWAGKRCAITVNAAGGDCHADSNTTITLDFADCNRDDKELTESCLFELNNAKHYSMRGELENDLKYYRKTLLQWGFDFAAKESGSTEVLAKILRQRKASDNYEPSTFGKGHATKYAQSRMPGAKTVAQMVAESKHHATATVGVFSLESRYMYAYERFDGNKMGKNLGSARAYLYGITTDVRNNRGNDVTPKGSNTRFREVLRPYTAAASHTGDDLREFFVAYIRALARLGTPSYGWTITWNDDDKGNWREFAAEVVRVANNSNDTMRDDIVNRCVTYLR